MRSRFVPSLPAFARTLALVCISFLSGCPTTSGKEPEPQVPGGRLIGTWEQTTDDEVRRLASEPPTMTFNADGTFVLAINAMGQKVKDESTWKLVEDTPEMIRISSEAKGSSPGGEARIYFVDPDTIKIGVAQSTKHFIFWQRVK
jgi:hypothetical protein